MSSRSRVTRREPRAVRKMSWTVLLNGTPEQKKKLIREYLTGESESSSEDEFEKEMEAELSTTIKTLEGTWTPATAAAAAAGGGEAGRCRCSWTS
ncbi:hypothetical protein PBY51_011079 [Eleginops maclovinus]|uniref:Uncharacterized protein n=1 Tax=Eleginops maclovinus TaxID=56733 RepID=A0AAN7XBV5_ELEMC|nr:hypothetical protein PBY51_011079 [Eleginops maclovinus]